MSPREVLAPGGWATSPAWSPDGAWIAAQGILEAEPLDDVSPGILLGPADASRPPHLVAPDLDRPIGNWTDSDLTGWFVYGRNGPFWADHQRIVATISDRGRSHPWLFTLGGDGKALECRALGSTDGVTHSIAVGGDTVAFLGTDGTRAMELMTVGIDHGTNATPRTRSAIGSRWQRAFAMPEMRLVAGSG